ncbi:MAG: alpha/beta fold hydrolase [Anaerolineae bacterium]|nr:alpha/beta fold hydrolase [Anaerolineae bacterium]
MQRVICGCLIVFMAVMVLPASVHAQDNPPGDLEAIAQQLIDRWIAGDYEGAAEHFDSTMQDVLPPDKLRETWQSLEAQVGAFQGQLGVLTESDGTSTAVIIVLQFEVMALDARVSFNADGQVQGLFFSPSTAKPELVYETPDYADPSVYEEFDVIVGEDGSWPLPGTLTLPVGEGPFPAVVLVHGSGANDRDSSAGANKPFRDIAWGLASQGIAVLRYDKRTVVYGDQMADMADLTVVDETIADAVAAVALLQAADTIDPTRVFVAGHSMGGYLAPRIAAEAPTVAGIVILAGNTRLLEDLFLEQNAYLLGIDGDLSETDQELLAQVEAAVLATKNVQPGDDPATLLFNVPPAYWLDLHAYDPVATARQITQPILVLQGERDYQVTLVDFQGWQDGLSDRADVTFKSYAGLNHLFMSGEGPSVPAEYDSAGHVAGMVIDDIAAWVLGRQP